MKKLSLTQKYNKPICLALGFFDCVHKGHAELIKKVTERASELSCESAVLTFCDNPYVFSDKGEKLIFTFSERAELLSELGADLVISPSFESIRNLSKDEFLNALTGMYDIKYAVCGHDYKFGKFAGGNTDFLLNRCKSSGIECNVIPPITYNGSRISSTAIKNHIACGEIEKATDLLGHEYFISGEVCHGRGVGRFFDFPTANIKVPADKFLPACGVYATNTVVGGKQIKSVTNVGSKPTFGVDSVTVETMLLNFNKDIYGENIRVDFVRKLRDIRKFDSPEELRTQIYLDSNWR